MQLNHYGYRTATYSGSWLHGMRNLLHGVPGARRDHGSASASRRSCMQQEEVLACASN